MMQRRAQFKGPRAFTDADCRGTSGIEGQLVTEAQAAHWPMGSPLETRPHAAREPQADKRHPARFAHRASGSESATCEEATHENDEDGHARRVGSRQRRGAALHDKGLRRVGRNSHACVG